MKSTIRNVIGMTALLALFAATPVHAQGFSRSVAESTKHSAQAVGHSLAAGGKLVSGVAAVPLLVVGGMGQASMAAGQALWETADGPLPVTDENFTAGPNPGQAMKKEEI
ncbi:MAG: mechanosensitive ion channel protein MscS [Gammaproteobacteria bacterium]|nr:mechanosensitive ion channel protein MscS [Gammaproteobacteria bacterium]MDH5513154.1 mechanosensitive ion channel protein MscS [Gammaproteobacteria bacterium]